MPPTDPPENATEQTESRSERITACMWCSGTLPPASRRDRQTCSDRCRHDLWAANASIGRVASVRILRSGQRSVTVHVNDAPVKPGDAVKIAPFPPASDQTS